ncbi:MAG: serine/threonine-protein kinase [Pirellulaceae bacterium]|nr:serine/threonine-protein kinase [Pirellulaceae bacterium]
MSASRELFAKRLVASGLMTGDELGNFWDSLRQDERPTDGNHFARTLVRAGRLTEFQAGELAQGRATPLVLEPYVLLGKIGAGGMGQVFKAQHRRMKRVVALKVLSAEALKSPAGALRFQREVEAAARLIHPNIVTAFDANEFAGSHFLVMEYVEGIDLSTLIKRRGALPLAEALDYAVQTARGIAFAHAEGIIHRDIKPSNLLLDKRGTIKILDMGLARLDTPDGEGVGLTASGEVMGTIDYMAPEQALDTKRADARADIYSLGCTLYRMLTGEMMYEGDTFIRKLIAHSESPIPELAAKRTDLPATLEQLFRRMVAKTPGERPQTMAEVLSELEAIASGPIAPTPISAGSSISRAAPDSSRSAIREGFIMRQPANLAAAVAISSERKSDTAGNEETIDAVRPLREAAERKATANQESVTGETCAAGPSRDTQAARGKASPSWLLIAAMGVGAALVVAVGLATWALL